MKKFAKISLMTAGIMGAVGCLLCLICVIFGGRSVIRYANDEYMSGRGSSLTRRLLRVADKLDILDEKPGIPDDLDDDELKILKEVPDGEAKVSSSESGGRQDSAGADSSQGTAQAGGTSGRLRVNNEDEGSRAAERHLETGDVRNLYLMLGAGTFTISEKEAGVGETIDLYIQGEGSCDYYVKNGTLCVEGFKGIHTLGSNIGGNNITLKLPMGMSFEEVELEIGAGVMELYDTKAKELEATVGAGELDLFRSEIGDLSVEIGAGELYVQETTAREADLTVSFGACTFVGEITHSLEAECDMGNMEFRLKGKETDYNYEIECSGGNIEMDSFETAAFAMEKEIDNRSDKEMELRCSMGNITIHFEEEKEGHH